MTHTVDGLVVNWWPATILGPVVLAAVLAYALFTRRRLTPREKKEQHRATEREYEENVPPEKNRA